MSSIYDKSSLVLIPSGTKTSKVYSQVPTNGDGDFDFTRSTAATRVNASGNIEKETSNLLTYSNDFSNSAWTKVRSSLSSGVSDPFGGSNAWAFLTDTTADEQHYFSQSISQSGVGTLSIYAKANGYNWLRLRLPSEEAFFDLANGVTGSSTTGISASITNAGSGWYRCEVAIANMSTNPNVFIHIAEGDGDIIIGGTPSGTDGLYIYAAQLNQGLIAQEVITTTTTALYGGITDNVPRLDYTDSSCPALLLEPQRTNILANSELLSDFTKTNITEVSGNQVTPEGVLGSIKISPTSSASVTQISKGGLTIGIAYSLSFFVKAAEASNLIINQAGSGSHRADYNISNLTTTSSVGITANIKSYGNNWVRVEYITSSLTYADIRILLSDGSGNYPWSPPVGEGLYLWGFQLEAGSYPTSYIPTYGTSVTRNADSCNSAGDANTFNDSEGVLYAEIGALSNDLNIESVSISDTSAANRVVIFKWNTSNAIRARITSGGANINLDFQVTDITSINKIAVKYKTNDFALWINGVEVRTNTNGSNPSGLNQLSFNSDGGSGAHFYGNTKQILYFPTALSDTELATLTTI